MKTQLKPKQHRELRKLMIGVAGQLAISNIPFMVAGPDEAGQYFRALNGSSKVTVVLGTGLASDGEPVHLGKQPIDLIAHFFNNFRVRKGRNKTTYNPSEFVNVYPDLYDTLITLATCMYCEFQGLNEGFQLGVNYDKTETVRR